MQFYIIKKNSNIRGKNLFFKATKIYLLNDYSSISTILRDNLQGTENDDFLFVVVLESFAKNHFRLRNNRE